jgi:hypothetical protein
VLLDWHCLKSSMQTLVLKLKSTRKSKPEAESAVHRQAPPDVFGINALAETDLRERNW